MQTENPVAFHADWLPSPTPQFRSSFEKQQLAFAVAAAEGGVGLVVFPDATPKGRPLSDSSGGSLEDPTGKAVPSTLSETLGAGVSARLSFRPCEFLLHVV